MCSCEWPGRLKCLATGLDRSAIVYLHAKFPQNLRFDLCHIFTILPGFLVGALLRTAQSEPKVTGSYKKKRLHLFKELIIFYGKQFKTEKVILQKHIIS